MVRSQLGSGSWHDPVKPLQSRGVHPNVLGFLCGVRPVCQRISAARRNIGLAAQQPSSRDPSAYAHQCVGFVGLLCGRDRPELDVLLHDPHYLFDCNHTVLDCSYVALSQGCLSVWAAKLDAEQTVGPERQERISEGKETSFAKVEKR